MKAKDNLFKKSKGSLPILIAVAILGFLAFLVIVAGIALMSHLTGNNAGAPENSTGGMCGNVPEPYNTIFSKAGDKFKVRPAFIAAIFLAGEHHAATYHFDPNTRWPNADGPWGTSGKGAQGPFQFMPGTWSSNKQDGDGDGVMDVQNLYDASFAAAHLFANIGAGGNTADIPTLQDAASKYNSGRPWSIGQGLTETAKYVPRVIEAFQYFSCTNASTGKWIWPVQGPITSRFGETGPSHPKPHQGLDIGVPSGTAIKAVDNGAVTRINTDPNNICGIYVYVDHGNGLQSLYCHIGVGDVKVTVGQKVNQGETLALSDNTGHSTGPHLHLGAKLNGKFVDPLNYLPAK